MDRWLKAELHCHTIYSGDSLLPLKDLLRASRDMGIDRLAVTDHNTVRGAMKAKELDPERVIVGEEIKTQVGELLAYFVQEEVPPFLSPEETLSRLRAQGAFVTVAHPFDLQRSGWPLTDLFAIIPHVDAIEVFNSRCLSNHLNEQAAAFAAEHNLAATAGSDAHTLVELGRTTLRLPEFDSAESLRRVIRRGEIQARLSPAWVHLSSRYSKWVKTLFPSIARGTV